MYIHTYIYTYISIYSISLTHADFPCGTLGVAGLSINNGIQRQPGYRASIDVSAGRLRREWRDKSGESPQLSKSPFGGVVPIFRVGYPKKRKSPISKAGLVALCMLPVTSGLTDPTLLSPPSCQRTSPDAHHGVCQIQNRLITSTCLWHPPFPQGIRQPKDRNKGLFCKRELSTFLLSTANMGQIQVAC